MRKFFIGSITGFVLLALSGLAVAEEAESFFSQTELQIHADFNRQPLDADIWVATLEHFSEWQYGDNFFFLDIEGEDNFRTQTEDFYFEYAPRISLDRILGSKILDFDKMGETYLTIQYNEGSNPFVNQVWLYGISLDFAFQPNYGFSNLHLLVRKENTQDLAYQFTYAWGQPFQLAGLDLDFRGFADFWKNDAGYVFLAEPQLRLKLSSLVGSGQLLSNVTIGTEFEVSHNLFGAKYGWEFNPTIFVSYPF